MTLYGCTVGTRLGYIIMGIEYLQAFSSICRWCWVKSGGFYYPSPFKVILIVHLVYTKWNVYFSLQHRPHYLRDLFEEGLPWDCLDLPRTFHSAFRWLLLIYWEICADICIICVHECLSNLMTSTRQRQFSSWYHFVALLLLYPLVPVINAYLLRNKFVPNLYKDPTVCAYSYFFVAENSWISRCFNR